MSTLKSLVTGLAFGAALAAKHNAYFIPAGLIPFTLVRGWQTSEGKPQARRLFAAVKGGVLSFSRSLARSLAPTIRVNVLGPGWIETAFGDVAPMEFKQEIARGIPLRRWGTPEDVASAAIYLLSDAAQYVTGQLIMVNGGDVM